MLRSVKSLRDYHVRARDGSVGRVIDFLFDGQQWAIRYVVADTSEWLPGRHVLFSPDLLGPPSTESGILPVALGREQVRSNPDIETDRPISQQHEVDLFEHYGWSAHRSAGGSGLTQHVARTQQSAETPPSVDSGLRSTQAVAGYSIHASHGHIGHVEDFIIDEQEWIVRYIVIHTRNWLPGRKVIISPEWVGRIDWQDRQVWLDHSRDQIRHSPHYDPSQPVNRQCELHLYDYYGRPKYWG